MKIQITYLYPQHMNLYGDTGNIICLQKRCEWRNIEVKIVCINPGDTLPKNQTDIYFFGGGQDAQQEFVAKDLQRLKDVITSDIQAGVPALTICGGYQLFGHKFVTKDNHEIPGIGVFDVETYGSDHRMIGNAIVKLRPDLTEALTPADHKNMNHTLVGFENHSGETKIISGSPLGQSIKGHGNDYTSKEEGYQYKNAFGTYLHGSLLPKNPHFADFLILKALARQYQETMKLAPLDDTLEWRAHQAVLKRYQ